MTEQEREVYNQLRGAIKTGIPDAPDSLINAAAYNCLQRLKGMIEDYERKSLANHKTDAI